MNDEVQSIECAFGTEEQLYLSYMPFIKGGGLFIRTKQAYELGASILLKVQLPNESEFNVVDGKVVWVTPPGAQGNKPAGIGIQFISDSRSFCNKIETCLAGVIKSTQMTDTI